MAMGVPLMSSERATRELGWEPRVTATEALAELLESGGGAGAHGPSRAGTGGGRDSREPERKLLEQLADAHAIAEQAAAQMRRAPAVAGDARLAAAFEEHLTETEEQERRVRARLEAHGADPANAGLAGKAGGIGVAVFAERLPDTPGELAAHSFSYAHMQIAAYELLRRTAEAAGDEETGAMAEQILEQERRMAKRLEGCFDAAVDASLNGGGEANLASQLDRCLGVAHAIERQGLQLLETGPKIVEDEELKRLFGEHLRQSEEHEAMVRERIEARSAAPSRAEDAPLRISGMQVGAFLAAQPDTVAKLTGLAFAFEQLEIAAYELLARLARRAGDGKVVGVVERILAEERAAARALAGRWDRGGA
jgi:ferritin-like metal-binding protein YciE